MHPPQATCRRICAVLDRLAFHYRPQRFNYDGKSKPGLFFQGTYYYSGGRSFKELASVIWESLDVEHKAMGRPTSKNQKIRIVLQSGFKEDEGPIRWVDSISYSMDNKTEAFRDAKALNERSDSHKYRVIERITDTRERILG